jgi:hypothetical protein
MSNIMPSKSYNVDERGVVEVLDREAYTLRADASYARIMTCGACGRSWDDAVVTAWTPAPSARCPFEHDHPEPIEDDINNDDRVLVRVCIDRYLDDLRQACLEDQGIEAGKPGTLGHDMQERLRALRTKFNTY